MNYCCIRNATNCWIEPRNIGNAAGVCLQNAMRQWASRRSNWPVTFHVPTLLIWNKALSLLWRSFVTTQLGMMIRLPALWFYKIMKYVSCQLWRIGTDTGCAGMLECRRVGRRTVWFQEHTPSALPCTLPCLRCCVDEGHTSIHTRTSSTYSNTKDHR